MRYVPRLAVAVMRHVSARPSSARAVYVMLRVWRSVKVDPSVTTYWSVSTLVLSLVGKYTSLKTPSATVNQTLERVLRAVPTQSLRDRSKCESAPGPSVAGAADAVAGGVAPTSAAAAAASRRPFIRSSSKALGPARRYHGVRHHRHGGVAPVQRDHAPAGVRGGAAQVQAVDRRARRQPVLPHLVGRDLALEDVAAGEADARLDIGRAEHLIALQPALEAGREAVDQRDELARDVVSSLVPGAARELVRRVLAEHAQQMAAGRRGTRVVPRLDVDLAEPDGGLAAVAGLEAALRVVEPAGQIDRRPGGPFGAGGGRPLGERVQRGVELHDGAADLPGLETVLVVVRDLGEEPQRDLRVGVADHGARVDERALLEPDAPAGHDLGHGNPRGELRSGLAGGVGDREADHAHAALDVAPYRALALEVALVVHELDRGGARVLRAAVGRDHALAEQRVLQALVAHVLVEHLGDRGAEHDVDHVLLALEQLLDLVARRRVAEPRVAVARAQAAADLVEEVLVGPVAVDVGLGDLQVLEAPLRPVVVEPLAERAAVVERDPQVGVGHVALEAALSQLQLADDELVEQADDVREGADDEAVVMDRPLERARAAEALAAFEHEH